MGSQAERKKKKKMSAGKRTGMIAGILVGIALLSAVVLVLILVHFYSKLNYVPLDDNYTIADQTETALEDVTNPDETTAEDSDIEVVDAYKAAVEEALKENNMQAPQLDDIISLLLIGTDERNVGERARADTIMLVNINTKTKQIVATSFLRDLYVYLPEKGFNKINASHAYGGIELLCDTLQYNFSIEVHDYITVNFNSFIKVVDILGGLDININEDELYWVNQYIHASNLIVGDDEDSDYLEFANGSPQHLNGKQALAYARVRYVGYGDFRRTERQRTVVNQAFDKLKNTDADTLITLLNEILPEVTTNIEFEEFLSLIAMIPELSTYEIVSTSVPNTEVENYQSLMIDGIYYLGIDYDTYIDYIYEVAYNSKPKETESESESEFLPFE